MSYKQIGLLLSFSLSLLLFVSAAEDVQAETSANGGASVGFDANYKQEVKDPENPENPANPGTSPTTSGDLRIDFVPQFNFWSNKISNQDATYYGNAQLFHDETGARGNFVQVSDYRGSAGGWMLQIRQETQFKNESTANKELNGAVISLDKSWANSNRDQSQAPIVSKDVIRIDNIGETYNLAQAEKGTGEGTWSIIFGASIDNGQGREDTLSPRLDMQGNPILDAAFNNKPIYQNEALSLTVPGATAIDPVPYQTVLTWILSELP